MTGAGLLDGDLIAVRRVKTAPHGALVVARLNREGPACALVSKAMLATWLSMMYPRLELLRELLAEDGSIWVSIDDNKGHYLKVIMDEIGGRRNFIRRSSAS